MTVVVDVGVAIKWLRPVSLYKDAPLLRDSPVFDATALRLAAQYRRTFYDSLYLALALHHDCQLVTADEKFVRAMQPVYPSVRWLRDYVSSSA